MIMAEGILTRPLFILWDYKANGPDGNQVNFKKRRNSAKYLGLAEYLVNNPPNKKPFKPRDDLGVAAHAIQTYRDDVETWVALRMMNAVLNDPEYDDEDLFQGIIKELHELPWYPGSSMRGFYYIQPMATRVRAANRQDSWAFDSIGASVPYMRAEGVMGLWYEPSFEDSELWKTRLAVNNLRKSVERYAEAALTGRQIGNLTTSQHWYLVNAAVKSIQKALQSPPDDRKKTLSENKEDED